MIDIKNLRDSIDEVEHSLARRGYTLNKDKFIDNKLNFLTRIVL